MNWMFQKFFFLTYSWFQCSFNFCCAANWPSHTYTYIPIPFFFFFHTIFYHVLTQELGHSSPAVQVGPQGLLILNGIVYFYLPGPYQFQIEQRCPYKKNQAIDSRLKQVTEAGQPWAPDSFSMGSSIFSLQNSTSSAVARRGLWVNPIHRAADLFFTCSA